MTARHQPPRRLRADAARNRDAIVAVARDVFAEQGLEAPLEVIAARAGVGIATLYRRFPTREKLVAAALTEKVAEYAEAAEQADPSERTEHAEPIDPIERTEPTEPIESSSVRRLWMASRPGSGSSRARV